jgi:general secretion pathway protein D
MKQGVMRLALSALSLLVLCGCASRMAYMQGQRMSDSGDPAQALAKFEEASSLDPRSAEFRLAAIKEREKLAAKLMKDFDQALSSGNVELARQIYVGELQRLPATASAGERLRVAEAAARHDRWIKKARADMEAGDLEAARLGVSRVFAENPKNAEAQALAQNIERLDEERQFGGATLAAAYRKPITIDFKDAPLRSVFEVISRTSGINFLFDKDVRADQRTSIFLRNSTIEGAINLTLVTNQLKHRVVEDNTVLIYPNTAAKQAEYQPVSIKAFYLSNGDAKAVAASIKSLLKTKDVVVDEKLNLVVMRDSADVIRMAEKLVALHDVAEPEVMLEVEVLEIKRASLLNLGVRWPDQVTLTPLKLATAGGVMTIDDLRNLTRANVAAAIGSGAIAAGKTDTDANILANPRIRAKNREKAKILIGERVPNITTTTGLSGFVGETVTYVEVGLKLDVEPTITPEGEVTIKVAMEVSNIVNQLQTRSGSLAYQIGTRTAQTVLQLRDGENQVLAGLINDEDRSSAQKVPALGDVPLLGRLFGLHSDSNTKTEIVLSITPRIVRALTKPRAAVMEFSAGTESNLGGAGGSAGAAARPAVQSPLTPGQPLGPAPGAQPTPRPGAASSGLPTSTPGAAGVGAGATTGIAGATGGVIAAAAPVSPTAAGSTVVRWQGPASAKVGDVINVQLLMESSQPIVSLPLAIGFDPRILQITSVTEGDFMRQGNAQTSAQSRVDANGQLVMTITRVGQTGATSAGSVVNLQLRVLAAPPSPTSLELVTMAPIGLNGASVSFQRPTPLSIAITP